MIKHLYDFSGRTRRKIFWPLIIIIAILQRLCLAVGDSWTETYQPELHELLIFFFGFLLTFCMMVLGARRMHDMGKSGWWYLVPFISLIHSCQDSEYGPNKWGANPKQLGNEIEEINAAFI
jgi:uncharacterized membrane protein YhaH (DUF805 family)